MRNRLSPLLLAAAILAGGASVPARSWASATVNVLLQDPSTDNSIKGMTLTADPSTVKAGTVTFQVANASKGQVHEMIVVMPPKDGKLLPYDAKKNLVIEGAIHSLGEVSERDPGQSGRLTLNLRPGKYILMCNQAGHYEGGMWTTLTVAR